VDVENSAPLRGSPSERKLVSQVLAFTNGEVTKKIIAVMVWIAFIEISLINSLSQTAYRDNLKLDKDKKLLQNVFHFPKATGLQIKSHP
jgi:hypothetical protein